jgi:hypothetical protein
VKIVTPHKSEKEISIMLSIQKKESAFEMAFAFMHGKSKLTVESEFDLQPNDWNINMKVQFIPLLIVLNREFSIKLKEYCEFFLYVLLNHNYISLIQPNDLPSLKEVFGIEYSFYSN